MKVNGFHHIGLKVTDMEKSLKFYRDGLGGKIVCSFPMADGTDNQIHMVDMGDNSVIELIPTGSGKAESEAHWAHVALVSEDAAAAYEYAISSLGARSQSAPADIDRGTIKMRIAFVYGPDDEIVEFFQPM